MLLNANIWFNFASFVFCATPTAQSLPAPKLWLASEGCVADLPCLQNGNKWQDNFVCKMGTNDKTTLKRKLVSNSKPRSDGNTYIKKTHLRKGNTADTLTLKGFSSFEKRKKSRWLYKWRWWWRLQWKQNDDGRWRVVVVAIPSRTLVLLLANSNNTSPNSQWYWR